ncbi:MAG: NTP transferase domain-containing protein [Gemmatimonadota bacterium]|nr:MAG: NTP transferase domain-containing protein [Gemmatimonadota bacterium]
MRLLTVIPARIGSSRLPGKPLRTIGGQPLVSIVAQRALGLALTERVVVAADSRSVLDAVAHLDVDRILTSRQHRSGTERIAEVMGRQEYTDIDAVLDFQVDQPFLPDKAARGALRMVRSGFSIGTAAAQLDPNQLSNRNVVKVWVDNETGHAKRFSRVAQAGAELASCIVLHHLGVYAYTRQAVLQWVALPECIEEQSERLEQLRPMTNGMPIGVATLDGKAPLAIDTQTDLEQAQSRRIKIRDQSRKSA